MLKRPRHSRSAVWLGALGLLLNGCAKETAPAGCGDTGGTRLVVFASDRNQTVGQHDLYLYDLDAGGFRLIGGINTGSPEGNPSISPDAELIAFEATRGASGSDIFLYSRCDQTIVGLPAGVNTAAAETEPAFSGDSNKLAFTRVVSGFRRIFLVDGVGDTLIPLPGLDTTAAYSDWAPSPNQDGSLIAFVSDRNGTPDVFVWDRALRMVRLIPVLQSDSLDLEPSLTPDGHYLTFASNRAGGAGERARASCKRAAYRGAHRIRCTRRSGQASERAFHLLLKDCEKDVVRMLHGCVEGSIVEGDFGLR